MKITSHISHDYNEELDNLRNKVLSMGNTVEEQFNNSTTALLVNDIDLAKKTAELDYKVNTLEIDIDEECAAIIARRQPKAVDLRNLFAISKVVTDLERVGDESEKIARFTIELETDAKSMSIYKNLKSMVEHAKTILRDSIDCYARLDGSKAIRISTLDNNLDLEFEKLNRLLSTYLLEDTKNISSIIKVMWCARAIERVGDHAKNICEYVVYIIKGKDIRHAIDKDN